MPDIRLDASWLNSPKRKKLQRRLGKLAGTAFVDLLLWTSLESSRSATGSLDGMTNEDIALAAEFDGDADEFVETLCEVGLLEGRDGNRVIKGWVERQTFLVQQGRRIAKAKKAASVRWGREGGDSETPEDVKTMLGDAPSNAQQQPSIAPSIENDAPSIAKTAPSNAPDPTRPDNTNIYGNTESASSSSEGESTWFSADAKERTKRLRRKGGDPVAWSHAREHSLTRVWDIYRQVFPQPALGGRPLPEYDTPEGLQLRALYADGIRSRGRGDKAEREWETMVKASLPAVPSSKRMEWLEIKQLTTMLKASVIPAWLGAGEEKPTSRYISAEDYFAGEGS